ncbi:chaperone modulator CbpM [Parapedobacter indicus]|uniref:MerR HTH family regulatory protein n=1 Tax=Parapedobacter indicus TaxID=1477437 RepID=A0A1I3FCM3_9SPHI|nr:chaperone modulator CbpM [Parapedobacter indicus]PPL03658.1 MerR-like DNA binding protein [Parapedobacter indicus]SFI08965.1 MerR HTH family regulatory protein [Parapedobacter indicus]
MKKDVITVKEYCHIHQIEVTFIDYLEESGLVQLTSVNRQRCIPHDALGAVERLVNWHMELEVNPQGLEVANTLYQRVLELQEEIVRLRSALKNS